MGELAKNAAAEVKAIRRVAGAVMRDEMQSILRGVTLWRLTLCSRLQVLIAESFRLKKFDQGVFPDVKFLGGCHQSWCISYYF